MKTTVTDHADRAAAFIRSGRTAAFPTETVYGLGADAFDPGAVAAVFEAKGRPADNPLIVHLPSVDWIDRVAGDVPSSARRLLNRFIPGPLTLIVPRAAGVPDVVTAGLDTVGVRVPSHPVAQAFLAACDRPVAAPSANRSGRPSPTTWEAVLEDLDGRIPCLLRGGRSPVGLESTVVDTTASPPVVLRAGAVSLETLREVVPALRVVDRAGPDVARSPGMRHRHYAPRARVVMVDQAPEEPASLSAYIGMDAPSDGVFVLIERPVDVATYAHELFDFLRRCDAAGVEVVYVQKVPLEGLGAAVMDRLQRASEA